MNTRKVTGDMADQIEKDRDELMELKSRLAALESVVEQCDRSLEACLRWPQVSKNEHLNGVQASRAAIKKVKEGK